MDWYNFILLIGMIQGFFLCSGLLLKNYGKKKQNYYFLALILLISLALSSKYLFSPEAYQSNPQIWYLGDLLAYCIGPLWFFTIQKSIQPKVKMHRSDYWLLLPILYHIGFLIYIFSLSVSQFIAASQASLFNLLFYIFCFTVLVVNAGFLFKAYLTLKNYRDSQFPRLLIQGQYAFLAIIACWLLAFLVSFIATNTGSLNLYVYNYAFISLSFLTFAMAYLALVRPESFYFLTQTYDGSETFVLQQIAEKVTNYVQEEEPYLKSNFSLNELSQAIQSNPVLTSKAINRILQTNYNDLINQYRVKHFIQLSQAENSSQYTLWAIAQEAGFGNKVTFYKSFKKIMGTTPSSYLRNLS